MASLAQWIAGARIRTWPNAIAPVVVGTGAATAVNRFDPLLAALALAVSVFLIVGVNYANDYSDGVRGTDGASRVGPFRLVGSGAAGPDSVRTAAVISLVVAAIAGVGVVVLCGQWWMLGVGAACLAAAWFYTGGSRPYGYAGFGELAVFVFFGLVAVLGTMYTQAGTVTGLSIGGAVAVGCFSSAVLVANNLRDIPTDRAAGKRTLAVLLGDRDTRTLYCFLVLVPFLISALLGLEDTWALLGFLALALLIAPMQAMLSGARGRQLLPAVRDTGLAMLVWALVSGVAFALG